MARISPGTMTAAIFAILIGLGGAYAVRQYLHQPPAVEAPAQAAREARVYVPVAAADFTVGRQMTINDIVIMSYTPQEIAKSPYAGKVFMRDPQQIVERQLRIDVEKGHAFEASDFFAKGMGPGVAELLQRGLRAVAVPIDNTGSVAGFARPGTIVDVLFRSTPYKNYPEMTMTLLEGVEVLAVNDEAVPNSVVNSGRAGGSSAMVTLAVAPDQAKALKVVEGRGELTLILRSPDDVGSMVSLESRKKLTIDQLLGLPFVTRVSKMDVWHGGNRQTLEFEEEVFVDDNAGGGYISTPVAGDNAVFEPATTGVRPSGRVPAINGSVGGGLEAGGGEAGGGEAGGGEAGGGEAGGGEAGGGEAGGGEAGGGE